jgi:hypothetical protein
MRILAPAQDDIEEVAGKVSNGVEDGPHTDGAEETSQSTSKVVRLPRDWLGPHEELVPFGNRAAPAERGGSELSSSPPSAEDFWGERSAAIHDVVQASSDKGFAESASRTTSSHSFGRAHRRLATAAILSVAAATATVIAVLTAGPGRHVAGDARLNMAAILTSGVTRILDIGPPRIISATGASRPHLRPVRRVPHRAPLARHTSQATRHQTNPPPPAPSYAARATPATTSPTYHSRPSASSPHTSPSHADAPASSGATVSPTGESGALGPVQSPNG